MPSIPRQRSLSGWVAAIEQQSKVWLPLSLRGISLSDLTIIIPFYGFVVLVMLATILMTFEIRAEHLWLVFWSVGAVAIVSLTVMLRRKFIRQKSQGWVLDFHKRTLTPVGMKGQSTIKLEPDHSLSWVIFDTGKTVEVRVSLVLHLEPTDVDVTLTEVCVQRGSRGDAALIDRCLGRLIERLGLRYPSSSRVKRFSGRLFGA